MSRDNFDIPEVFRRAMEEAGWSGGGNDGGDGRERRPFPSPDGSRRPNRGLLLIGAFVLLFLSFNWIVTTYTDWLWFVELDYSDVWVRQWLFRILSFALFFAIALLFLLLNWHLARRRAIRETPPFNPKFLQLRGVSFLLNGMALFLSLGFASSIGGNWETILRYFYRQPFGQTDPIFNRDISFYLFELPVFELFQQWIISLLVLTLLGTLAIYAINNIIEIQRGQWQPQRSRALRQHVAILAGLVLILWAGGYLFSLFHLLYSPRGVVTGASYTDLNVSRYAIYAQMVLMALVALAVLYNIFRFDLRPVAIAAGLWLLATFVGAGILPGLVQRYSVDPNEIDRESPYIAYNIEYTRLAFDLNNVEERPFAILDDLTQQDLDENEAILRNVRLWDYRPLATTYEQLQALRLYYQFSGVDIDRYEIDGETRQVMLAARELDKENLPNSSWVNRNLEFTHGYGIVMNPVDRVTGAGQPEFFIKDLPPQSNVGIEVTRPEIYYGELTTDAVFVGSDRDEFSYSSDQDTVYSSYAGTGGVPLDNYLKRLAFALRLGEANVLLSDEINTQTRVQFHRQIQRRVEQITPFLRLDPDPYLVVANGRLIWIQDAYTVSNKFPYAESVAGVNYIRNAAKVTIDAYDGTVTYYLADPEDPIIQTYAAAFPSLFKPMSELPENLQAHVRYPEQLFRIQAEQYLTYHMTNVRVFYNQEDKWQIPTELFENTPQPMEPYYVILQLPGEETAEYLLIQPFTPAEKPNMVAWIAARNDGENYGHLIVYQMPRQELVIGPSQVEARIDQDTSISEQFTLWNQSGSSVIRGNLLAIPINNNFLYVEPIYLQATDNALPELKRVVVATNNRIAMRTTLAEALAALLSDDAAVISDLEIDAGDAALDVGDTAVVNDEATPIPIAPDGATIAELIDSANRHFEAAEAAQRDGDWTTYGQELEALQNDLARLSQLVEQE